MPSKYLNILNNCQDQECNKEEVSRKKEGEKVHCQKILQERGFPLLEENTEEKFALV